MAAAETVLSVPAKDKKSRQPWGAASAAHARCHIT